MRIMTVKSIFGEGEIEHLENLLEEYGSGRVFLVTGKGSYTGTGLESRVKGILKGREYLRHSDFENNPCPGDLMKGAAKFREFSPDIIIAIGGGSVIDTAKLLSVLPEEREEVESIIKGEREVPERKIPFIALPTTAGSGSEATCFAVVYSEGRKYSVASETLLPDYAVLDPELTYTLSHRQSMVSAFDAFSQAVESYWAVGSTSVSRAYASESIGIILEVYDTLNKSPDKGARRGMLRASHLSGKAINISKTTGPHALSYALTMRYGIPHGYAVILTLPGFFIYNAAASGERISPELSFREHSERMENLCRLLGVKTPEEAAGRIRGMIKEAGFKPDLKELGIKEEEDIRYLVKSVNAARLSNNPVLADEEGLREVLAR